MAPLDGVGQVDESDAVAIHMDISEDKVTVDK